VDDCTYHSFGVHIPDISSQESDGAREKSRNDQGTGADLVWPARHCRNGGTAETAALPKRRHCRNGGTAETAALPKRRHCRNGGTVETAALPKQRHCRNSGSLRSAGPATPLIGYATDRYEIFFLGRGTGVG
jgi:hypothetical protein